MKPRKNFLSPNNETKLVVSAIALKSITLIAIFAVGIFCTLGSGTQSGSRSFFQTNQTAKHARTLDDYELQTEINERSSEISQLENKIAKIRQVAYEREQKEGKTGYYLNVPERSAISETKENISVLNAERSSYQDEVDSRKEDAIGCFTAETKILTKKGYMRIADIKIGDRVLTVDADGNPATNNVVKTFMFSNNHYYFINEKIKVTAQHKFYTGEGWTKTKDLKIGDNVQLSSGAFEEITSKERFPADLTVYNLHIADNHNFFVSTDGENGYLVHNCGGDGGK